MYPSGKVRLMRCFFAPINLLRSPSVGPAVCRLAGKQPSAFPGCGMFARVQWAKLVVPPMAFRCFSWCDMVDIVKSILCQRLYGEQVHGHRVCSDTARVAVAMRAVGVFMRRVPAAPPPPASVRRIAVCVRSLLTQPARAAWRERAVTLRPQLSVFRPRRLVDGLAEGQEGLSNEHQHVSKPAGPGTGPCHWRHSVHRAGREIGCRRDPGRWPRSSRPGARRGGRAHRARRHGTLGPGSVRGAGSRRLLDRAGRSAGRGGHRRSFVRPSFIRPGLGRRLDRGAVGRRDRLRRGSPSRPGRGHLGCTGAGGGRGRRGRPDRPGL